MSLCNGPSRVRLGEFTLDREDERLWSERGAVRIGNKAFLVLSRLAEEQGRLVTKDDLFSSVWDGTIVSESALTSVVKELRRALGDDPRQPRYIQSVYGRGYRLIEPVRAADGTELQAHQKSIPETGHDSGPAEAGRPPLLYMPAFDDALLAAAHPWLGEIIREELLLALSRFKDLRLVSDIAAQGVPRLLSGAGERDYALSVRLLPDGTSITVFAKIFRLHNQEIIWADKERLGSDEPARDVDLLVRKIAAAALPKVQDDVTRHLPARTEDAFGLYLKNKLVLRSAESLEEMQAVAADWERLIEAHPRFAQAYAPLIYLYNTDYGYTGLGSTGAQERRRAYDLARKAVRLEPSEPYLHTVSAWCHLWAGEVGLAHDHLDQALDLNPFHRDRLLEVATALMFLDELDSAAELLARCETLTPFNTGAPHEEAGLLHLLLGQHGKATECLRRVVQPTVSSDLYALIAAGASDDAHFQQHVVDWVKRVQGRWRGAKLLDAETLGSWILNHHPFQQPRRREWLLQLLLPALNSALQTQTPPRSPVPGQDSSTPSAEAAAS